MSFLEALEGRGRAALVEGVEEVRREERVEVKAREVEEDSSLGMFFGLRVP